MEKLKQKALIDLQKREEQAALKALEKSRSVNEIISSASSKKSLNVTASDKLSAGVFALLGKDEKG